MPLAISESRIGSIKLLNLAGTLVGGGDTEILAAKVQEVFEAGEVGIILDLGQVTFIDSAGIGALIRGYSCAKLKGASIKLLHLTKRIYDVLQIARLSSVFEIFDDLQKAAASFQPGAKDSSPPHPEG